MTERNAEESCESLSPATQPDVIEMFGFDPLELNMLGFDLDDDEIASTA
jgi:hypothetical protein